MKFSFFLVAAFSFIGKAQSQVNLPAVKIGSQTWTKKNLNVTTYRNGDPIPEVKDSTKWSKLTTGAWCYYNNDPAKDAIYGKLYNWYAVNDPRGLAPAGWHLPDNNDWEELVVQLGGIEIAGGKMKEPGTIHWSTPNTGATNSSGFTGLPGGYRFLNGKFYDINYSVSWWSTSDANPKDAWAYGLSNDNEKVGTDGGYKQNGFSVRCVKD
jgi:uncharacterized protein (TIGR02145 family)